MWIRFAVFALESEAALRLCSISIIQANEVRTRGEENVVESDNQQRRRFQKEVNAISFSEIDEAGFTRQVVGCEKNKIRCEETFGRLFDY